MFAILVQIPVTGPERYGYPARGITAKRVRILNREWRNASCRLNSGRGRPKTGKNSREDIKGII